MILVAVTIAVVWWLNEVWLAGVFALVAMLAAYEWSRLLSPHKAAVVFGVSLLAMILIVLWFTPLASLYPWILYAAAVWWSLMFLLVSAYRREWCRAGWSVWIFYAGMPVVLAAAWVSVLQLHELGAAWLLYLLLLVAVSDIGAYYIGRRWGQRRLSPDLSAGKTVVGLWGGLICVAVLAAGIGSVVWDTWLQTADFIMLEFACRFGGRGR